MLIVWLLDRASVRTVYYISYPAACQRDADGTEIIFFSNALYKFEYVRVREYNFKLRFCPNFEVVRVFRWTHKKNSRIESRKILNNMQNINSAEKNP